MAGSAAEGNACEGACLTMDLFRDLLVRWGRYVVARNRASNGYALPNYSGMAGGDAWRDGGIEVDPDVLRFDDWIKKQPLALLEPIWVYYVEPGPIKAKTRNRGDFYADLNRARDICAGLWDQHVQATGTDRPDKNAVATSDG